MKRFALYIIVAVLIVPSCAKREKLTDYVNPFLGTATLWDKADLGYERHKKSRTWGAETFPGPALPNGMVQMSPVTQYGSGAGYQREDTLIYSFAHTNKGHWNLLHVPLMPVTGDVTPGDYASPFRHETEHARPGFYSVELDRYGIKVELTATLRCALHRYRFPDGAEKKLLADLTRANGHKARDWAIKKESEYAFSGFQRAEGTMFFYVRSNYPIVRVDKVQDEASIVGLVRFGDSANSDLLELRIGFSFVSEENARQNLDTEVGSKSFEQIKSEADATWEEFLEHIRVKGGTDRQKRIFYSCLYRAFMWPALRSDVNGEYTDAAHNVVNTGHAYYTEPSFWDDYRNKLVLMEMLKPGVAADVIESVSDMGEKTTGYMPTFFHGDHAATFVAGSLLRGVKGFDAQRAYKLILHNATVPGHGGRKWLEEYMERGWIAEKDTTNVPTWDEYKAAVTKTVEYCYDDYATALVAKGLGDTASYRMLMARKDNYKNLFDPSTGFWRGRIEDGSFIKDFDPYYPYYAYMYREANGWQSLFYAPHDPEGMVALYPSKKAVEDKLDSLFTEPWRGYEADNFTGFIGNYCHGNQPDHSVPYMYYYVGRQDKAQMILDSLMNHYYAFGPENLALAGMDDAGEMTSWFVFNAIGLYSYSPADPRYIITAPLFDEVKFTYGDGRSFKIRKEGTGRKISNITYNGKTISDWHISDSDLRKGKTLRIVTEN